MKNLPIEIWTEILKNLLELRRGAKYLTRVIRCSRIWYRMGMPVLYRRCSLNKLAAMTRCLKTLQANTVSQTSVRCLEICVKIDRNEQDDNDPELYDAIALLFPALQRLPYLKSLHLHFYQFLTTVWEGESPERLEEIFPLGVSFPFQLISFTTSFKLSPKLARFISSQSSLEFIHFISLRSMPYSGRARVDMLHMCSFPSIRSIAFTHIGQCLSGVRGSFLDAFAVTLRSTPSVQYLTIDIFLFYSTRVFSTSFPPSQPVDLTGISGLTVIEAGSILEASRLLSGLAKSLCSLEYLAVFLNVTLFTKDAFSSTGIPKILQSITTLQKALFGPVRTRHYKCKPDTSSITFQRSEDGWTDDKFGVLEVWRNLKNTGSWDYRVISTTAGVKNCQWMPGAPRGSAPLCL